MRTHEQIRRDLSVVETKLKRWRTRIKRAVNAADALERRKKRLEKLLTQPAKMSSAEVYIPSADQPKPATISALDQRVADIKSGKIKEGPALLAAHFPIATKPAEDDQLEIPSYLRRRLAPNAEPGAIKELVERGKAKAKGQEAKRKARRSGDTKKMPLSGREALAFIAKGE